MTFPIFFNDAEISKLPVYDDLDVSWELMGANEIQAEIELPGVLYCPIGAYINYNGLQYTVNTAPSPQLTGDASGLRYKYTIVFESPLYRLYDKKLKHLNNKTFQFYGDLESLCYLIVQNINTIDSGWTVGICDAVSEKPVDFDKHTCRTALDTVAEAFAVEWYLSGTNGKTINFVKQVGNTTTLVFKYGRGNGLYSLGYQYQNDQNIVTRAFGYGSGRNLPKNYRDGATELMFDGYSIDKNVDLYRVKEGDYVNEDIYPKIDGHVSAVSVFDPDSAVFTINDAGLTFNLNDYFSSDTPKLSFTSGELQGQEFDILSFNNSTKTIRLKVATDKAGNNLPSELLQAIIGDTYTLFDMYLPDEVVTDAEDLLRAKTQEWLNENSVPRVLYNLELDPLYARDNNIMLKPGDKITVQHAALGIDTLIRVTSISYPVNFPAIITPNTKITATIANFIPYTTTERVISDTIDNQHEIKIVDRTNSEKARLNSLNMRLLQSRIFNPDGTLFNGPDSLIAGMATFGFDSQNFNLNNVTISPNNGADANALSISGGELVHRIYKVDGLGYTWAIAPNDWTGLDPAKFYYVYAKCSKTSLAGTWEISETPVSAGDITGYWAFNIGILYEVNADGYRDFEFTKGMTYIVGDQITTGRIKDITSQNYFDLSNGKFNVGDSDTGFDWDVTTPATLTIRGALASKVIKVGVDGLENAGISGLTDNGVSSIRFWAGAEEGNKDIAIWRVETNGTMWATRLKLGYGESGGNPTGWDITPNGIISDPDYDVTNYNFALLRGSNGPSGQEQKFELATELIPSSTGGQHSLIANIVNKRADTDPSFPTTNTALHLEASGANENIALDMVGGIKTNGATGISGTFEYRQGDQKYEFVVVNGLIVGQNYLGPI